MTTFDLAGKVALVTGAGQGVGAGIATTLAEHGAAVAVNDLDAGRATRTVEQIVAQGGRAQAALADVGDRVAVDEMVEGVRGSLGPVDVLVHNAGIPASGFPLAKFRELEPEAWEPFIRVNLYGMLHCARAVVDDMCRRGTGRIVFISSEAGRVGIGFGVSLYSSSKAGAVGFCRALSQEVAGDGVTVNCLSLGLMASPETEFLAGGIPVGRAGTPADVAAAVLYLVSDEAAWVTGQTLPVNGGAVTS
jgi:NAD(P)-dependent dehydrogenase (short-subunit alcohol dehydrogenase family)